MRSMSRNKTSIISESSASGFVPNQFSSPYSVREAGGRRIGAGRPEPAVATAAKAEAAPCRWRTKWWEGWQGRGLWVLNVTCLFGIFFFLELVWVSALFATASLRSFRLAFYAGFCRVLNQRYPLVVPLDYRPYPVARRLVPQPGARVPQVVPTPSQCGRQAARLVAQASPQRKYQQQKACGGAGRPGRQVTAVRISSSSNTRRMPALAACRPPGVGTPGRRDHRRGPRTRPKPRRLSCAAATF